jgi:hypothetical protein
MLDHQRCRALWVVVLTLFVALAFPNAAHAQWPTALMFHSGGLPQPIFITGTDSVTVAPAFRPAATATATAPATTAATMGNRPYVSVACFWGPPSDPAMNGVRTLADLKPAMAWQHARFYPATAGSPAMVFITQLTKMRPSQTVSAPDDPSAFHAGATLSAEALAVLKRAGVPISTADGPSTR